MHSKIASIGPLKALCTCSALLWSLSICASDSASPQAPAWPDTFLARVEALALLQTLNADLLSHDSATVTLEHWCRMHRLASRPQIVAERVPGVEKLTSPEQRQELGVTPA